MHEEGHSGGHDIDVTFSDVDRSSPSSKLKEIIQEQKAEINNLNNKLLKAKWVINYLEQRNKQLEDQHTLIELQQIREDRQAARRHIHEMTPIEQEIEADWETWLERVNIHLEKLLAKANRDKDML